MNDKIYFAFLMLSVMVASISQLFLKKESLKEHNNIVKEYLNFNVIFGYFLMVVSTLLTILAYSKIDYKNGPIIEAVGYPLILILGYYFFKERITIKKLLGNILIIIGIIVFYM